MADDTNDYLPIIGSGENLIEPISKTFFGGQPAYPRTYGEAKNRIKTQLSVVRRNLANVPMEKRMDDFVITLRLNEKFLAKSYVPETLFKQAKFQNIGSRRWVFEENEEKKYSKLHFLMLNNNVLTRFEQILDTNESQIPDNFKNDIRKIEQISLLSKNEVVQGFSGEWDEGTVEFVLHPYGKNTDKMIDKFKLNLQKLGVDTDRLKIKTYAGGPTFVSAQVKKNVINGIADFNPLRTVHPLKVNFFPELRSNVADINLLYPPKAEQVSQIKVGIFDGGIDESHPFLKNFTHQNKSISSFAISDGIKHGTAVAGVALYGDLNQYEAKSRLIDPIVYVESFRVLPVSDPTDFDLYEVIDFIEKVVPERHDIDVYNLSFGPVGPILDDEITRFTFSLDTLAWNDRKLFVVAVGNDGERPAPLNRIQAPSDIVNGLSVGAYTFNQTSSKLERASYSCIGDGREGCKVKPDLCAFGGDQHFPIHLLNASDSNFKWLAAGTSFAAPIVAAKAAELLGRCPRFNPLVARALLINSAINPNKVDKEIGYGFLNQSVDDILRCDRNRVNIIYSNSMNPKGLAKLPIPLPLNANITTTIKISWTIAILSKTNNSHTEDYTESAIEDTFYPHDRKYKLSNTGINKSIEVNIDTDSTTIEEYIQKGYKLSTLPVSKTPEKYQTELARREELKWDTVVKRWKSMRPLSLHNPFLVLHALGRDGSNDRMDYAVVVTIDIPKYTGNLYEDILNEYRVLEPVKIKNRNDVMISIS
ncbi:S8 family peptidase [Sporolactobacillus shoreicorticis]|uniref:S8 family peptidase n=1 Tax=Sporolactobacillus shoreicorticis TaxID=1923877 RepID=A0ABW5S9R9_9BACL|nr:S8 family peptidase [Sporolactobacillus shoreicorticis]MCO7126140.1 S8 family peptidase [Sporolactobacillus shoreicorticis]